MKSHINHSRERFSGTFLLGVVVLLTIFSLSLVSAYTEAHGRTLIDSGTGANDNGIQITIGVSDLHLGNVTRATGSTPLNARLLDASFNVIKEVPFVGNNATINETLIAGQIYYVVGSEDGGDYTMYSEIASPYPIAGGHLTWTAALEQNTTVVTNRVYLITRLEVDPVNSTAVEFNSTTIETKRESYIANLTNTTATPTSAVLVYNGTEITATITQITGSNYTLSVTRDVPTGFGSNRFYFKWNEGAIAKTTVNRTQTVQQSSFGQCNSTLVVPFINYTFQDEGNQSRLTASIPTSSFTWWIGSGLVNKTISYTNNSNFTEYNFCVSPNSTINLRTDIQYQASGYNQRRYKRTELLSNATITKRTLYLLAAGFGTYSIYQVQTSLGNSIPGVSVEVEKQISGSWQLIEGGITDTAGSVTFWLNPDQDHRISFTKSGYSSAQVTIRPSSTTYTVTMTTSGAAADFNSSLEGIEWIFSPKLGRLAKDTTILFGFNVTANKSNIVACKMELVNSSDSILNSTTTGCSANGGNLSLFLNTSVANKIWGKYYLNFGSGYVLIDSDAYWITNITDYTSDGTLWSALNKFKNLKQFGEEEGRKEYSRIVFIFLILTIFFGGLSYSTNWDTQFPGGILIVLCLLIWIVSFSGLLTLTNLTPWDFMDKYVVTFILSLVTIGYLANNVRRNS